MTLTYNLTENDYLQLQLFIASKSDRVKKQRRRSWLIMTASFFIFSFACYNSADGFLTVTFLIVGLLTLIFYPSYQRNHYKKHYQKSIKDIYKNNFNETANVIFGEDVIETFDRTGTTKINLTEVEVIYEITSHFFVKLKSGPHLMIPKREANNVNELRKKLDGISKRFNVNFISELNWKWK